MQLYFGSSPGIVATHRPLPLHLCLQVARLNGPPGWQRRALMAKRPTSSSMAVSVSGIARAVVRRRKRERMEEERNFISRGRDLYIDYQKDD